MLTQTQTSVVVEGRHALLTDNVHDNISIVRDTLVPKPGDGEALVKLLFR